MYPRSCSDAKPAFKEDPDFKKQFLKETPDSRELRTIRFSDADRWELTYIKDRLRLVLAVRGSIDLRIRKGLRCRRFRANGRTTNVHPG